MAELGEGKKRSKLSKVRPSKGQLNSEWIYEVIVSSKIPTKNYKDFWPLAMKYHRQIGFQDVQNAKFW